MLKKIHIDDLCECGAYKFPHRLGSGACINTSLDGPICGECLCHCNGHSVDFGIGPYEFWGAPGIDTDVRWVSDCCEATMYTDQRCVREVDWPEEDERGL